MKNILRYTGQVLSNLLYIRGRYHADTTSQLSLPPSIIMLLYNVHFISYKRNIRYYINQSAYIFHTLHSGVHQDQSMWSDSKSARPNFVSEHLRLPRLQAMTNRYIVHYSIGRWAMQVQIQYFNGAKSFNCCFKPNKRAQ